MDFSRLPILRHPHMPKSKNFSSIEDFSNRTLNSLRKGCLPKNRKMDGENKGNFIKNWWLGGKKPYFFKHESPFLWTEASKPGSPPWPIRSLRSAIIHTYYVHTHTCMHVICTNNHIAIIIWLHSIIYVYIYIYVNTDTCRASDTYYIRVYLYIIYIHHYMFTHTCICDNSQMPSQFRLVSQYRLQLHSRSQEIPSRVGHFVTKKPVKLVKYPCSPATDRFMYMCSIWYGCIYIYIYTQTCQRTSHEDHLVFFLPKTAQDQIIRFGGDTDPSLPWPENHTANNENSMERHLGP